MLKKSISFPVGGLLVSMNDNVKIRIRNFQIENTKREKLLGIQFDNKLSKVSKGMSFLVR